MSDSRDNEYNKIERLDSVEGWNVWKFQVKILLKANSWFTVVDGSYVQPVIGQFENAAAFNKALEDFTKSDFKAQKVIVQTIGRQPTLHIMSCNTAREMWLKLESVYEQKSETSVHMLQEKFYLFSKDPDEDIAVHISKLQGIAQQLKDLGEIIPNSMIITKVLMTLPDDLKHFQSAWESTAADKQTIENLTNRLMIEESRARLAQQRDSTFDAFVARKFSNKKAQHHQQQPKSKSIGYGPSLGNVSFVMKLVIGSVIVHHGRSIQMKVVSEHLRL